MILGGLRGAVSRFLANDGMFLAAGLAFFVLLSMIPVILLGVATLGFVLSTEQAANEVVGQLARNFPVYKHEITRVLLRIVQTRKASGIVGTVVLVLGVLLFVLSAATWFLYWVQFFVLQPVHMPREWVNAFALGGSLALSAAMFYLAFRYVPRRRMRVEAALAGAILASGLWEVAKQLFRLYIRKMGVYDQIYGPLAVLVAFVMFVYYSAIVFVFAAAYAATLDTRRR